jgi:hypothetical protein
MLVGASDLVGRLLGLVFHVAKFKRGFGKAASFNALKAVAANIAQHFKTAKWKITRPDVSAPGSANA